MRIDVSCYRGFAASINESLLAMLSRIIGYLISKRFGTVNNARAISSLVFPFFIRRPIRNVADKFSDQNVR